MTDLNRWIAYCNPPFVGGQQRRGADGHRPQQNAAMVEELAAAAQEPNGQVATVSGALNLFRLNGSDRSVAEVDAVELRRSSKDQLQHV